MKNLTTIEMNIASGGESEDCSRINDLDKMSLCYEKKIEEIRNSVWEAEVKIKKAINQCRCGHLNPNCYFVDVPMVDWIWV